MSDPELDAAYRHIRRMYGVLLQMKALADELNTLKDYARSDGYNDPEQLVSRARAMVRRDFPAPASRR